MYSYKTKQDLSSFHLKHQPIINQKIYHYTIKHSLGTVLRNNSMQTKQQKNTNKIINSSDVSNQGSHIYQNVINLKMKQPSVNKSEYNSNRPKTRNMNSIKSNNTNTNNKIDLNECNNKKISTSYCNIEKNNSCVKRNRNISLDLNIIKHNQSTINKSSNNNIYKKVTVNIKGSQQSLRKSIINGKKNSAIKNNINKNFSIKVQTIKSESNKHNNIVNSSQIKQNHSVLKEKEKEECKRCSTDQKGKNVNSENLNKLNISNNNNNKNVITSKEIKNPKLNNKTNNNVISSIAKLNFSLLKKDQISANIKSQRNKKSRNLNQETTLNNCNTEKIKKINNVTNTQNKTTKVNFKTSQKIIPLLLKKQL